MLDVTLVAMTQHPVQEFAETPGVVINKELLFEGHYCIILVPQGYYTPKDGVGLGIYSSRDQSASHHDRM